MIRALGSTMLRRRGRTLLLVLPLLGSLMMITWQRPQAEELVDLTLLFHSAVQGKIAPCG